MPSPKSVARYPAWYFVLITSAQYQPVILRTARPVTLRKDLYAFRSAIRRDVDETQLLRIRVDRLTFARIPEGLLVHTKSPYPSDPHAPIEPLDLLDRLGEPAT